MRDETEVVTSDQGWSYGCAFGDFDRDGDLDLSVANCYNATQTDFLYENHSAENGNNWLMVQCVGTTSNKSAIGAEIWLYTTINGQQHVQLREISAQSGYCGQNLPFTDSVTISWEMPVAGVVQLEVIDLQGKVIYSKKKETVSGTQEWIWEGRDAQGRKVPACVYVIKLQGQDWQASMKVIRE